MIRVEGQKGRRIRVRAAVINGKRKRKRSDDEGQKGLRVKGKHIDEGQKGKGSDKGRRVEGYKG